jgi:hypothetical protein
VGDVEVWAPGWVVTNPLAKPNISSAGKTIVTMVTQEGKKKEITLQKRRQFFINENFDSHFLYILLLGQSDIPRE